MANLNKELAAHESLQLHLREESDKLQAQLEKTEERQQHRVHEVEEHVALVAEVEAVCVLGVALARTGWPIGMSCLTTCFACLLVCMLV